MTNFHGYPIDPLSDDVYFNYKARTDVKDTGPNSLADASGGAITSDYVWGNNSLGAYYNASFEARISFPALPDLGNDDWTLEFWATASDWDRLSASTANILSAAGSTTGTRAQISVRTASTSDNFALRLLDNDNSISTIVDSSVEANDDAEHYFAVCRKGDNVFFYVDGILEGIIDVSGSSGFNFSKDGTAYTQFGDQDAVTNAGITGRIADFRFTNADRYDGSSFTPLPSTLGSGPASSGPGYRESFRRRAWGFTIDGHHFYVLHAGRQNTWIYDLTTGQWCVWKTAGFGDSWNAERGVFWNGDYIVADQSGPVLYKIDPSATKDDVDKDITRIVTGGLPVRGFDVIPCHAVHLNASLTNPTATAPTVSLRWSDDNGQTWSAPRSITISDTDTMQSLVWRALGSMKKPGRIFEFTDVGGLVRIDDAEVDTGLDDGD